MPTIVGLGLAAAAYPQLLAIVVVILTRPEPRRLLWACYIGAMSTSVGCGIAILLVFRDRAGVIGSSSRHVGPAAFLIVGVIALLIAWVVASERARGRLGRRLPRRRSVGGEDRATRWRSMDRLKGGATGALARGSVGVAIGVGVVLGVPGPFDLLALGRVTRGGYALGPSLVIIVAFNLIKLLLIELPILSYVVDPRGTAARVDRFSAWMKANQLKVIAVVIAAIGVLLIARGASSL